MQTMNKYFGFLTILLFPMPGVVAVAQDGGKVELKKGDRILFFGDSLTYLAGIEGPKKYVTKGYVRIV